MSTIYESDLKLLELKKLNSNDSILIFNNNDCNFEIFIAQNIFELKKNIKIVVAKTNILDVEKCQKLVSKTGFKNLEIKYINDLEKINNILGEKKFKRIILRENIGIIEKRFDLFTKLKKILDIDGFIYIKTLVFTPIKKDNFMVKKQFDIIDFWNYNFSTTQNILYDLSQNNFNIKYKDIPVLSLVLFYNPQDIVNILKLYFVDLNLGISNIIDWLGVYTLKLLHVKTPSINYFFEQTLHKEYKNKIHPK